MQKIHNKPAAELHLLLDKLPAWIVLLEQTADDKSTYCASRKFGRVTTGFILPYNQARQYYLLGPSSKTTLSLSEECSV